jgi:hypothetical protein
MYQHGLSGKWTTDKTVDVKRVFRPVRRQIAVVSFIDLDFSCQILKGFVKPPLDIHIQWRQRMCFFYSPMLCWKRESEHLHLFGQVDPHRAVRLGNGVLGATDLRQSPCGWPARAALGCHRGKLFHCRSLPPTRSDVASCVQLSVVGW